jgi:hypothetical protein
MPTISYTKQLEFLILEVLLPTYYKYTKEHNLVPQEMPQELMQQIKSKQVLPRLLQPK